MEMLANIPESVLGYVIENGLFDPSNILIATACRRNTPGGCGEYLFASLDTLYVLDGVVAVKAADGKALSCFTPIEHTTHALCDVVSIESEELVSALRLSLTKKDGTLSLICEAPNTFKESLLLFADYLRLIMCGEFSGVDDDDKESACPKCGRRYPDNNRICPYCSDNVGILKKLLPFFARYRRDIILILSTLVLTSVFGVVSPYIGNSFYIDSVLTEGGEFYGRIMLVIIMMLSVKVVGLITDIINNIVTARVAADITYDLKKTIFASVNKLSLSYFTSRRTGGLITQIESDSSTLYDFFGNIVPNLSVDIVKIAAMAVVLFIMNPILALISFLTVPLYVFSVKRAYIGSRRMAYLNFSKARALTSRLGDVLNGFRVVKAFARENDESARIRRLSGEKTRVYFEWTIYDSIVYPTISLVLYFGTLAVWTLGGVSVMAGDMSYGDLLTFVAYMGILYSPLNHIINSVRQFGEAMNAASRLFEVSDAIPDVKKCEKPIILDDIRGEIEFKNVSFSYTKSKKTIDHVSFKVAPGSTLGIVGHTGAGKSTIVNLLSRLYDVSSGEILIDGVNVKNMSFEQLRRLTAVVSQETYLFSGSIYENIAYAIDDASYDDVVHAAIEAGAHDFIVKLPDGYETQIGFGNRELSGGERQRISIARALLKKPRILILDEATAAMDTATEKRVEHAIEHIGGECTTVMIAHRLSTLKSADKLIVIEDGKTVEAGTHDELIEKRGVYFKLYTLQLEALRNVISDGDDAKEERMPPPRHGGPRGPRPPR